MKKTSKLDLATLAAERAALPDKIAEAAMAGDATRLAELRIRQAALENEIFAATCAARQAEIEMLESQKAEAVQRAREAAAKQAEESPRLIAELDAARKRILEIPGAIQSLHRATDQAQSAAAAINSKIEAAKQSLDSYVKTSSAPPLTHGAQK